MYKYITLLIVLFTSSFSFAQKEDSLFIRSIYDEVLTNGKCYGNLEYLCKEIGARLSGSPQADLAINWGEQTLKDLNLDKVYRQEILVPVWKRGQRERANIMDSYLVGNKPMNIKALGGSIGTPPKGITAEVVVVESIQELSTRPESDFSGKIVLFNRPMDAKLIDTFSAYGGCVDQRWAGAKEAVKYGAVAVLVRSLTHNTDEHAHTGVMDYGDYGQKIPAAAVSTDDANAINQIVKKEGKCMVNLSLSCSSLPDAVSYNVIGEITGSEKPDSVIIIGGHLDSWDVGEGAHDDGAGIVHCIEAMRLIKESGYKPRFTIRCVLFMNEENGNRGGKKYAEEAAAKKEYQYFALESDRGGFSPRGFSIDATLEEDVYKIQSWSGLLSPFGLHLYKKGYAGVDIKPIKEKQDTVTMCGFIPDSQRYFDYHHSDKDVFETVNQRELELGAASIASMIYLVDKYGWESR